MNRLTEGTHYHWAIPTWELEERLGTKNLTKVRELLGAEKNEGSIEKLSLVETIGFNPQMIRITTEIDEEDEFLLFEETPDDWEVDGRFATQRIQVELEPNELHQRLLKEGIEIKPEEDGPNPYDQSPDGESPESAHLYSVEAYLPVKKIIPLLEKAGLKKPEGLSWGEALFKSQLENEILKPFGEWCLKEYGSILITGVTSYCEVETEDEEELTIDAHPFFNITLIAKTKFGPIAQRAFQLGLRPFRIGITSRFA